MAQYACRRGHSALHQRVPRLGEELNIRHANGISVRWLDTLKNTDVLLLDDWGVSPMNRPTRAELLEIIDDRAGVRATIADAMLDRLMQSHHRFTLTRESLRKKAVAGKAPAGGKSSIIGPGAVKRSSIAGCT